MRAEVGWEVSDISFLLFSRFLVHQGCIPPLCDLLTVMDSKIVQVALNGLENILRFGEQESKTTGGPNPYAVIIEEVFGLDKIEFLQVRRSSYKVKIFHCISSSEPREHGNLSESL